jgi:hypothetical protein
MTPNPFCCWPKGRCRCPSNAFKFRLWSLITRFFTIKTKISGRQNVVHFNSILKVCFSGSLCN